MSYAIIRRRVRKTMGGKSQGTGITILLLAVTLILCWYFESASWAKSVKLGDSPNASETLRWHTLMINERGSLFGLTSDDGGTGQGKCIFPQTINSGDTLEKDLDEVCKGEKIREGKTAYNTVYLPAVRKHINSMLTHMREATPMTVIDKRESNRSQSGESEAWKGGKKLLIFVHGGLNSFQNGLDRAVLHSLDIASAGYYPIFINWNSEFVSTYAEHAFYIRQGKYHDLFLDSLPGVPTAPFYLFSDLVGSIGKLPISTAQLWLNDLDGSAACPLLHQKGYDRVCGDDPETAVTYLNNKFLWNMTPPKRPPEGFQYWLSNISWLVTQPTKILTSGVLVQAGAEAWNDMLRRIDVGFRTDADFQLPIEAYHAELCKEQGETHECPSTGALAIFFQELGKLIHKDGPEKWDITVIGHSMGTIMLNRAIQKYGEDLPISTIVYMAAACSIKDYEETVWPYIKSRQLRSDRGDNQSAQCEKGVRERFCKNDTDQLSECEEKAREACAELVDKFPIPNFYNLMLHPKIEAREIPPVLGGLASYVPVPHLENVARGIEGYIFDPAPRGSLLVWLDGFLTNPATPLDRMLGRFTNFMLAADRTPPALAPYIHPKVFGADDGEPNGHGSFSECDFWKREFWKNAAQKISYCPKP